jgi:DNA polymerase I-like protein with 3'-5' exonuclease and polymerase domains
MTGTAFRAKAAQRGQLPLLVPDSPWTAPLELPSLRGVTELALDTETKDLDLMSRGPGVRRGARIVGISLGFNDQRMYLPIGHEGGGNLDRNLVLRWAREELNAYDGEVIGTNLGYDLDFLAEEGVTLPNVKAFHDVQVAEPLIDEWRREYNLDALSYDYLGEGKEQQLLKEAAAAWGFSTMRQLKQNIWRLPANLAGPYAEGDVDRPLRIWPLQRARLEAEDLLTVYNVERQLIPILVAMRRRGVPVNIRRAEMLRQRFVHERDEWVRRLKHLAGPRAELMEPKTLAPALEARGIMVPYTRPSKNFPQGQISIAKAFLEQYQADELVRVIAEGRKINTIITTFLDSQILGYALNGRIHPTFTQLKNDDSGTIGRFSGEHPNLQFIPARDEVLAPLIRGIFEPENGEDWQRDDASQIEYRFLTHYAVGRGAEEARESYRRDKKTDFHKMAANMLGADPEDKIRRKRVKNTNFCKVYGGGIPKVAATFGCSVEEAFSFVREYDEKLPFVGDTYKAAMKWANRRGFVVTILNRRQRFPFWEPVGNYEHHKPAYLREEALRVYGPRIVRAETFTALNKKLQVSAADMMKKAMVDIWNAGICRVLGAFLVTVHDELGSSVPRTPAGDEAGREVTRLMEEAVQLKVPIYVERDRGATWGEVS